LPYVALPRIEQWIKSHANIVTVSCRIFKRHQIGTGNVACDEFASPI